MFSLEFMFNFGNFIYCNIFLIYCLSLLADFIIPSDNFVY